MVLVDPDYCNSDKKVFASLLAAFRYGREDLDVLGLTFRKDLLHKDIQARIIISFAFRVLDRRFTRNCQKRKTSH